MVDITQASDTDIHANMDAFKAALRSKHVTLPPLTLGRILLAVDQSNQGETAQAFAAALARAHGARVVMLYAYEGARDSARERYLTERARALEADGVALEPLHEPVRTAHAQRSFEQILKTCEKQPCDLIVVPAPYLDDYEKLGQESVGANLDVLMCRARVPLFAVRAPDVRPQACLSNALLPLTPYRESTVKAAAWALKLVTAAGKLRLLAVIEHQPVPEPHVQARDIDILEVDAEALAGLRRPEPAGLIAALQRRTAESGLGCRLMVRGGDAIDTIVAAANGEQGLLVLPSSSEPRAHVFTLAIVRCSRNPVLLVPT